MFELSQPGTLGKNILSLISQLKHVERSWHAAHGAAHIRDEAVKNRLRRAVAGGTKRDRSDPSWRPPTPQSSLLFVSVLVCYIITLYTRILLQGHPSSRKYFIAVHLIIQMFNKKKQYDL